MDCIRFSCFSCCYKSDDSVVREGQIDQSFRISSAVTRIFSCLSTPKVYFEPEILTYQLARNFLAKYDRTSEEKKVEQLALRYPKTKTLIFSDSKELTDKELCVFVKAFPDLRILNLSGCEQITDSTIALIAPHLKQLIELSLKNCGKITDESLESLASHCKILQVLSLENCSEIKDDGLAPLTAKGFFSSLNVSGCSYISDLSFQRRSGVLRNLNISGCDRITGQFVKDKCYPNLEHLEARKCANIGNLQDMVSTHVSLVFLATDQGIYTKETVGI